MYMGVKSHSAAYVFILCVLLFYWLSILNIYSAVQVMSISVYDKKKIIMFKTAAALFIFQNKNITQTLYPP